MIWRVKLLHLRSSGFFFLGYESQEVTERLLEDFEKKNREKEGAGDQNGKATTHFGF